MGAVEQAFGGGDHLVALASEVIKRLVVTVMVCRGAMMIDSHGGGAVTAAEAGDGANGGSAARDFRRQVFLDVGENVRRAAEVAAHIAADVHLDFRRRRLAVM